MQWQSRQTGSRLSWIFKEDWSLRIVKVPASVRAYENLAKCKTAGTFSRARTENRAKAPDLSLPIAMKLAKLLRTKQGNNTTFVVRGHSKSFIPSLSPLPFAIPLGRTDNKHAPQLDPSYVTVLLFFLSRRHHYYVGGWLARMMTSLGRRGRPVLLAPPPPFWQHPTRGWSLDHLTEAWTEQGVGSTGGADNGDDVCWRVAGGRRVSVRQVGWNGFGDNGDAWVNSEVTKMA